jgi:hypothetical protein
MVKQSEKIILAKDKITGELIQIVLELFMLDQNKVGIKYSIDNFTDLIVSEDYFAGFQVLRRRFENLLFLCNGARKTVYPSGMQRDMVKGLKALNLSMGNATTQNDIVNIFDEAMEEEIADVDEQEAFYQLWLSS